jgi:hypothetical protein
VSDGFLNVLSSSASLEGDSNHGPDGRDTRLTMTWGFVSNIR